MVLIHSENIEFFGGLLFLLCIVNEQLNKLNKHSHENYQFSFKT
jgi:hypothetical protein